MNSLGSLEVPNFAYYGIQTERNRQAFDISDLTLEDFPSFIEAVAKIKAACARTNLEIGALDKEKAQAIEQAAWEVIRRDFVIRFRFVFTAVPELFECGRQWKLVAHAPRNLDRQ